MVKDLLFPLGRVYMTRGAMGVLDEVDIRTALVRHSCGDWGDLDEEDKKENNYSLKHGFRLLSAYKARSGRKFWVITEADRSMTTVLLPEEY